MNVFRCNANFRYGPTDLVITVNGFHLSCHTAAKIAEGEENEEDGGRAIRGQAATKEGGKSSDRKAGKELRDW